VGEMARDYHGREFNIQGALESRYPETASNVCTIQWARKLSVGDQCNQLEADLHWDDPGGSLVGSELGWRGQRDWEKEFEQLQYQALKKFVNATHGSRIELVSQIAGVESPRSALDTAQARLMGKIMWDTIVIGDLRFGEGAVRSFRDEKGRNLEAGREWDDFSQEYTVSPDGFTSVLTVIQSKAGVLKEEGHERMSYGGRVEKVEVPEVMLQAQADSKTEGGMDGSH